MIRAVLAGGSGAIPGWAGKGVKGDEGAFESEEIKKLAREAGLN